jgi:hypothetical protein
VLLAVGFLSSLHIDVKCMAESMTSRGQQTYEYGIPFFLEKEKKNRP